MLDRSAGATALLSGWRAVAAALPALFAPFAALALAMDGAPGWTMAITILGAAPLVTLAGAGAAQAAPAWQFAAATLGVTFSAAFLSWASGGVLSPTAPWLFASLGAIAVLGGVMGAAFAAGAAVLIALVALIAPEPPLRLLGFANRDERALLSALSWSLATGSLASVGWAASRAWTDALPPLRHPTIVARQALSALAEGAAACALRLNSAGVVTEIHGAPDRVLGLSAEELDGLAIDTLAHPDDQALLKHHPGRGLSLKHSSQTGSESATLRFRSRLGGYRWVEATTMAAETFPSPDRAGLIGTLGVSNHDGEILILRARWRDSDLGAAAGVDSSRFVAQVGSDLRASLKSIVGFSEILRNEMFGPLGADRYRDYARLSHETGAALLDRIDEMLDLADLEAGRFASAPEPVEIGPLLDGVMRLARARGEAAGVAISVVTTARIESVAADRKALRRMLHAMLLDGVRRVSIGDALRLEAAAEDGVVRFAVRARVQRPLSDPATAAPGGPEGGGNALISGDAAAAEAARAISDTRLGRLVATHLAEMMGGALMFNGGLDGGEGLAQPGEVMISEAIIPIGAAAKTRSAAPPPPAPSRRLARPLAALKRAALGTDLSPLNAPVEDTPALEGGETQNSLFEAGDLPESGGAAARPADGRGAASEPALSHAPEEEPLFDLGAPNSRSKSPPASRSQSEPDTASEAETPPAPEETPSPGTAEADKTQAESTAEPSASKPSARKLSA